MSDPRGATALTTARPIDTRPPEGIAASSVAYDVVDRPDLAGMAAAVAPAPRRRLLVVLLKVLAFMH